MGTTPYTLLEAYKESEGAANKIRLNLKGGHLLSVGYNFDKATKFKYLSAIITENNKIK